MVQFLKQDKQLMSFVQPSSSLQKKMAEQLDRLSYNEGYAHDPNKWNASPKEFPKEAPRVTKNKTNILTMTTRTQRSLHRFTTDLESLTL